MSVKFLLLFVWFLCVNNMSNVNATIYFSRVKNETPDSLYKVIVPQEDYEVLVPAGKTADFGDWINMQRDKEIQVAVIAGEGESIFVKTGPDIAACAEDEIAPSVAYWSGFPNITDDQKIYKSCCSEEDLSLELIIQPDGMPTIEEANLN